MILRRARGLLLRLVRRRALAVLCGLALVVPAVWLEWAVRDAPWWADGLSLILVATGLALAWTGLVGLGPDWIDRV